MTTRSIFYITLSKFISNKAITDSVISSSKANYLKNFVLEKCLFKDNNSTSNTISIKESNGIIDGCIFVNNQALEFSQNVFVIFSTLKVTGCNFEGGTQSNIVL